MNTTLAVLWLTEAEWQAVRLSLLVSVVSVAASLPFGMGIQFDQMSEATSVALLIYAESRFRALSL